MNNFGENTCPRCGEGRLRTWADLNEEQRMIVERLPAPSNEYLEDRARTHRWCTLCWYESEAPTPTEA
jgi:hypothetical protein